MLTHFIDRQIHFTVLNNSGSLKNITVHGSTDLILIPDTEVLFRILFR